MKRASKSEIGIFLFIIGIVFGLVEYALEYAPDTNRMSPSNEELDNRLILDDVKFTLTALANPRLTTATPTRLPDDGTACRWVEHREPLPALNDRLAAAINRHDYLKQVDVIVTATAFGRNCLNADGSVRRFNAIRTDFTITFTTADLSTQTIGNSLLEILILLVVIPDNELGSATTGDIVINATQAGQNRSLQTRFTDAVDAGLEGLSGMVLIEALGGLRVR